MLLSLAFGFVVVIILIFNIIIMQKESGFE